MNTEKGLRRWARKSLKAAGLKIFPGSLSDNYCIAFAANTMDCLKEAEGLAHRNYDNTAAVYCIARKTSMERTDDCPVFDNLTGGYCESDDQLRARIKASLQNLPDSVTS